MRIGEKSRGAYDCDGVVTGPAASRLRFAPTNGAGYGVLLMPEGPTSMHRRDERDSEINDIERKVAELRALLERAEEKLAALKRRAERT